MKIGLVRCRQTEDACPASRCLEAMRLKRGAFAAVEEEIICVGVVSCGGCPGKQAARRAKNLVKNGAEGIAIATCISQGGARDFPCPFADELLRAARSAAGENIRVFD